VGRVIICKGENIQVKNKISKILGVAITLVMVLSMTAAFSVPALADDEEWSLFDVPTAGIAGALNDGFMSTLITGIGPFAQATDGTLYLYIAGAAPFADLFSSDDNGRTWEATDYATDLAGAGAIVDMAPSSEDADILYVADATNVYKTEDAGDSWTDLGDATLGDTSSTSATDSITCIAVGYANGDPHLFVGTTDTGGTGEVIYYQDSPFASVWTDLQVGTITNGTADTSQVFSIATSPDFGNDTTVVAIINDGADAYAVTNQGAAIGAADWDDVLLNDDIGGTPVVTGASDPVFVEDFDFDDNYELFVGVAGAFNTLTTGAGGVFRLDGMGATDDFLLDDVDGDIVSLDLVGDAGGTSLIAGTVVAAGPPSVWYSTDDGDSWDETDDAPPSGTGAANAIVIALDDFADSGEALCASNAATKEGGVHMTTDFGATWQGISMLDTDMGGGVLDVSFTADYGEGDAPMFMITASSVAAADRSVWRYDGTNWERMLYDGANALDLVEVSPSFADDNAVFVADSTVPTIRRSDDGGATFTTLTRQPGAPIAAWLVIDDETIITSDDGTGTAGDIYKTTRYGRRAWDAIATGGGIITDLAMSPNYASDGTLLAGDAASLVFISTDEGEEWDELGDGDIAADVTAANDTYVTFDPRYADNMLVYAGSDDTIERCEVDPDEDPGDLSWTDFASGATAPALGTGAGLGVSGLVVADDGIQNGEAVATLYAVDGAVAAGLVRCLNPEADQADIICEPAAAGLGAAVDFSPVTGAAAVTVDRNLHLTYGSNTLYALDGAGAPDVLWEYTDSLAAPTVLVAPAIGEGIDSTTTVVFEWENLNPDTGVQWEIQVSEEEDFSGATDEAVGTLVTGTEHDDTTLTWRAAAAGTEYFWRVRLAETTGPVLSRWSEVGSFTMRVAAPTAPIDVAPAPGAQSIVLQPAFSWADIGGADLYEIEIATDPDFTAIVDSGTPTGNVYLASAELDYATTYYWRVRGIAFSGAPAGDWNVSVFTTMLEPEAAAPPVVVEEAPAMPDVIVEVPAPVEAIPSWMLITIIAIGAVLMVALIVLIVRTRRVV